jgi:hypothetical protein
MSHPQFNPILSIENPRVVGDGSTWLFDCCAHELPALVQAILEHNPRIETVKVVPEGTSGRPYLLVWTYADNRL